MRLASAPSAKVSQRAIDAALRKVDRQLGHKAVCLVGLSYAIPVDWQSNDGVTPVRVVVTDDPKDAARAYNPGSPIHRYETLAYVYVQSEAHGRRLKGHLDEMLFGNSQRRDLQAGWRDCELWIAEMLLVQAAQETNIEIFDEAEHQRRRQAALRRQQKAFRVKL